MGKPAARVGDMTAHGGVITGPGCPTVLIGKMPAAQIGNMHVCPMVTPAPVPVPHVGGPIVGPVPPTVFIGKMPAACVGDMCVCVGPPSSILPPGCPTVLIGMAGGGGGGGGGSGSSSSSTAQALQNGTIKPVSGSEGLPIEVQVQLVKAAQYLPPETVAAAVEAAKKNTQEKEPEPITIADFVEILEGVEREEGYEAARFYASTLDYGKLTGLAKSFITGLDTNKDNDPNLMPTRFMLLYGADDGKLKKIDDHPDRFGKEEHRITVKNLRKALRLMGYEVKETGPYDDEVLNAHVQYTALQSAGVSREYDNAGSETSAA